MTIVYILAAILIFGVLIAVHEFGHFAAAKLCGVQVNEFSIGMGPCLWQRTKGETDYSFRLLPIGGFCAMEGEEETSDNPRALRNQGFWKRFFIFAAGAAMNFITGVVIILVLYAGSQSISVDALAGLAPDFPQQGESGLMARDQIYKVNGYRTYLAGDARLFLTYAGDSADIEVVRNGEHITVRDLPYQTYTGTDGEKYQGFGLYIAPLWIDVTSVSAKLSYTWDTAMEFVQLVWFSLSQLVTGGASMNDLSGPVGIVATITETGEAVQAEAGIAAAVRQIAYFAALIAVNLAVMNLLPIPALDGGHILFLLIDTVSLRLFHKKIPDKYQAKITGAFFALLMAFMLFVTLHDVWVQALKWFQ